MRDARSGRGNHVTPRPLFPIRVSGFDSSRDRDTSCLDQIFNNNERRLGKPSLGHQTGVWSNGVGVGRGHTLANWQLSGGIFYFCDGGHLLVHFKSKVVPTSSLQFQTFI